MAADVEWVTEPREPDARSAERMRFLWFLLLGAGLLVFELTAQPALGITVACAKFGVEDFLTALWLRRTDPNRCRGNACYWFYMANGLWRVTKYAFLGIVLFVVIHDLLPRPQGRQQVLMEFLATWLVFLSAWGLSAAATFVGVCLARRDGLRIWLDATLHQSRRFGIWPPRPTETNNVDGLLCIAVVMALALIGTALCILIGFALAAVQPPPKPNTIMIVIILGGLAIGGIGAYLVTTIFSLEQTIVARSPRECWSELTDSWQDPASNPAGPAPAPVRPS